MINIYGKGGHAKMIRACLLKNPTKHWVIGDLYNDDDYHEADVSGLWHIAIGNNMHRKNIANRNSFKYVTIDFSTYQNANSIGQGCFLGPGSVIQNNVNIGDHTIINTSASIDHDCNIGSYVHIAPNSTLCGCVTVGEGTLVGAGSVILPYLKIGKNCIIGAGSVITKDVPDNTKLYGNPAKIV